MAYKEHRETNELAEEAPKVSVILPVYNVEPYIDRCIESLQAQTMDELEFIFVDDCSTDASMKAVEAWAAEDERVRILHNEENLGSGPSRNRGIEAARGDYLSFVDPDDYVARDFYVRLWRAAKAHDFPNIVKGSRITVQEGEDKPSMGKPYILNDRIRADQRKAVPLWYSFNYEHQSAIYLHEAVLRSGARYGTSRVAQDTTFLLRFCSADTHSIVLEDAAIYYYVVREASAVRSHTVSKLDYRLHALCEQMDCLVKLAEGNPRMSQRYANRTIESIHAPMALAIGRITGDNAAVRRFIDGSRQQLLRLTKVKGASSANLALRALVDHGIALSERPYAPAGEAPHAADWPPIIAEWLRFCNMAMCSRTKVLLRTASLANAALFKLMERSELAGTDADFDRALASIRQQLANSGPQARLVLLDPRLALFAAGGPALAPILKCRAKNLAKRILRR